MDTDQAQQLDLDLTVLSPMTWGVTGHGDTFSVTPNGQNTVWISPTTSGTSPSWTFTDLSIASPPQAKIELRGEDADIEINGESVVSMLREIRDRLNILQVSEDMEQEWDELRILREQYEAKLTECREKSRAWSALKQAG